MTMIQNDSVLLHYDVVVCSENEVQQGDPLGPLLFCLARKTLTSASKSPLHVWYLYEGILGVTPEEVVADLRAIQAAAAAASCGLELNLAKCDTFVKGGTDADLMNTKHLPHAFSIDIPFVSEQN